MFLSNTRKERYILE